MKQGPHLLQTDIKNLSRLSQLFPHLADEMLLLHVAGNVSDGIRRLFQESNQHFFSLTHLRLFFSFEDLTSPGGFPLLLTWEGVAIHVVLHAE